MTEVKASLATRGLRYLGRLPNRATLRLLRPALGTVRSAYTGEKIVALTFDDGPDPVYTPRLLDILAAHGAKATFFLVGEAVEANPAIIERMVAEGHATANHTYSHRSMPTLTRAERTEQLRRCARALEPFGGDNKLFRPPFGDQNFASLLDARRLGYTVVTWDQHIFDWLERDADFFEAELTQRMRPGSIFLLHDTLYQIGDPVLENRNPTLEAVDRTLDTFSDYAFVTVPTLLTGSTIRKTMWFKTPDA